MVDPSKIELLLLDVDGVLTDGRISYTNTGDELKHFHVRDGVAIKAWTSLGKKVAVVSGRTSEAVSRRTKELGIELVLQGKTNKIPEYERLLRILKLKPEQVCSMGDDLPDLPILSNCGVAVAVADACPEVLALAHYTTKAVGGAGAVREAIEWLLKSSGQWDGIVKGFLPTATPRV